MKGPPRPDPTSPTLANRDEPVYAVSELTSLAQKAWASLDERGCDVHGEWRRFTALVTPSRPEPYRPEADVLLARLAPTLARQETPTFHAHEVLHWVASKLDPWNRPTILSSAPSLVDLLSPQIASTWGLRRPRRGEPPPSASAARIANDLDRSNLGKTTLWPREQRWFVAGNLAAELSSSSRGIARSSRSHDPTSCRRSRSVCASGTTRGTTHPAGSRSCPSRPCTTAAYGSTRPSGTGSAPCWCAKALALARSSAGTTPLAREQLSALLARRFALSEAQAWILFVLRAAQDSCFVVLRANADGSAWTAVAHLGAGRIIRLRCSHYPLDDAASLSMTSEPVSRNRFEVHLDGGNVHLRILELDGSSC